MLTLKSKIQRNPNILNSKIDDEVVMMSADMKKYIAMNPSASDIWEMLEKPINVETIVAGLLRKYEIDRVTCENETKEFITELIHRNLIQIL